MKNVGHAVIIGASLGGLFAARVLADTFPTVTVMDRDSLPDEPMTRHCTPQSKHVHILLARGREIIDELFPGFTAQMIAAGCPTGDCQSEIGFHNDGRRLYRSPSGLVALGASRPLIEHTIRARVAALPGVKIVPRTQVEALTTNTARNRVTGVQIRSADGSRAIVAADLVIDASGRGSRSPVWLSELGYTPPEQERVKVNITYLTRHYHREPHHLGGDIGIGIGAYPGQLRGGYALARENNQITITLTGMFGTEAQSTEVGMGGHADTLTSRKIAEIIRTAQPLDTPVKMRYPASIRNRYEKLRSFPAGYLVVADALCSFNPVYGQGMTVAALEALLLQQVLAAGMDDLARRFFRKAAKHIDGPWTIATGGDLRFPEAEGKRTVMMKLINAYLARFYVAAETDPILGTAFLRVANLIDPPSRLLAPGIMLRMLRSQFRAVAAPPTSTTRPVPGASTTGDHN
ncbi:FAD-dependent oxidoreductase [Nocardia amamiensis]|uniref:FAD-dependent oxidoreductase n=1 Tax=Nocardia amamiensis TaxID=404578 RepID=UPI00082E228E|nr:hypothetical protein [Nocardia amamiensis]